MRLRKLLAVVAIVLGSACIGAGQVPSPAATTPAEQPKPQDPLNRTTPQGAVLGFLDACHSKNYQRALHYLDLTRIPSAEREEEGSRLAQELEQILNGDAQFDVATLSRDPRGDGNDGLAANRERLISVSLNGKAFDLDLERTELRQGVPIWRVAPDSVASIPELAAGTSQSPLERHLPAPLVNYKLMDTAIWRWIALLLLAVAIGSFSRLLSRLLLFLLAPLVKRLASSRYSEALPSLLGPLQVLLFAAVFGGCIPWVDPSAVVRLYLGRGVALIFVVGLAWLAARILDLGLLHLRTALDGTHYSMSRSVLPLVSRILKILILALSIVGVLSSWGYSATTLLAGLGIGGIAVALAAQKTIENLFGSFAVVSDRPVLIGDSCKFGDSVGTVEDIGLRSTRIRTLDRTLVTVPNGQFSSMTLANFSRRDKTLLNFKLNLRQDTSPARVREVLQAIQRILMDPRIEASSVPCRFIGIGQYSLDLEVFVYVLTVDGDDFLKIQQDLLLRILDAIAAAGTALALPTQASVDYASIQGQQPTGAAPSPAAASNPSGNGAKTS